MYASKHGISALTKTAAIRGARTGVRTNAICPGNNDTPSLRAATGGNPKSEKMIL